LFVVEEHRRINSFQIGGIKETLVTSVSYLCAIFVVFIILSPF